MNEQAPSPERLLLVLSFAFIGTLTAILVGFVFLFINWFYAVIAFVGAVPLGWYARSKLRDFQDETKNLEVLAARVEQYPTDPDAWRRLGSAYWNEGHYSDALRAFSRALDLRPNDINILAGLATSHYSLGQYVDALELWNQVAEAEPNNEIVWLSIANCKKELNDFKGALEAFKQARTCNKESVLAHKGISEMLKRLEE